MVTIPDRFVAARAVADAVLYEGYLLYPYRASATKNQVRWQFGVLVPPAFAALDPSERSRMRTEVVVDPGAEPVLTARVRFLQVQRRTVDEDGITVESWDEASDREIDLAPVPLLPLAASSRSVAFHVDGGDDVAIDGGRRTMRRRAPLEGTVHIDAVWADGSAPLIKVAVTVGNDVDCNVEGFGRREAVRQSLVGVHLLLAVDDGTFVSSIDPPDDAREAIAGCVNDGTFPVLVADGHGADLVLASPIILYDHPSVAPESQGDMFDATEIDEILALRVLTLTDAEKAEARLTDARAAAIIDRCDAMAPEQWAGLHGTMRSLQPIEPTLPIDDGMTPWWDPAVDATFDPFTDTLTIGGTEVATGTTVRLHPSRRADAHDMFLAGMDATIGGIFTDADGDAMVAVTLDDDPAREAFAWQGRFLFFHPDEIEVRKP